MFKIAELADDLRRVVRSLARYDYESIAPVVAGFLTFPSYHANTLRLDIMCHLARYACNGTRQADRDVLVLCAGRHLSDSELIRLEDPVEDTFIGNVSSHYGNFRLFRGIEESGDYWVASILKVFEEPNLPPPIQLLADQILALLRLSEAVVQRRGFNRYLFGGNEFLRRRLEIPQWRELTSASQAVIFSLNELAGLGISVEHLAPFIFEQADRARLLDQTTGHSDLQRFPLARLDGKIVLTAPHAVTVSVRRYAVERLSHDGLLEDFNAVAHSRQVEEWSVVLGRRFQLEKIEMSLPSKPAAFPPFYQTVMTFDKGKYAHVVLLDGNLQGQLADGGEFDEVTEAQQRVFNDHLRKCAEVLRQQPHFTAGMTLITRGGLGRGFAMALDPISGGWHVVFAALPDWVAMGQFKGMSALRIWRMHEQQSWATKHGLNIHNLNGVLNLFACWHANGWRFFQREIPFSDPRKILMVNTDFLTGVRKELYARHDPHSCIGPDSVSWHRVQRKHPNADLDELEPIYAVPEAMRSGVLIGSVEGGQRNWWIICHPSDLTEEARDIVYQLWDCVLNWMGRAAPQIETYFPNAPRGPICIELDIMEPSLWKSEDDPTYLASSLPVVKLDKEGRKVLISIPSGFKREFHMPENRAEQILVRNILEGVIALFDLAVTQDAVEALLIAIFPNQNARFFHVARTKRLAQMIVHGRATKPDFIPEERIIQSLIGVGAELGDIPASGKIEGEKECTAYMQRVVDKYWERIESALRTFDRKDVVRSCFLAIADLDRDREHWNMTARSQLALERNPEKAFESAAKRQSERDSAHLAIRILIETAMYSCQEIGGAVLPRAERLDLMANVLNMVVAANHRDAIAAGFMPPMVEVSPNGELDVSDEFYDSVMSPYTRAIVSNAFQQSADKYEEWFFGYKRLNEDESSNRLASLEKPFLDEFGVTVYEYVTVSHQINRLAIAQNTLVIDFAQSELIMFLAEKCQLTEQKAHCYLQRFSLSPRSGWDRDLPSGCGANDVWPWKFRRQLSLLTRPLLLISVAPENRWLVYAPLVEQSASYVLEALTSAGFPAEKFRSRSMKKFIGELAAREGRSFTQRVANKIAQLGFVTEREVLMSLLGVSAAEGDFGDVDVLAWGAEAKLVYVIECKHLRTAISVRDVVDRLDEYKGERDDSLGKHLRRLNWLRSKPTAVASLTGIPASAITFRGLLVTDDVVPMQFFRGSAIATKDVVAFDALEAALRVDT
jgi:hypothetical protein